MNGRCRHLGKSVSEAHEAFYAQADLRDWINTELILILSPVATAQPGGWGGAGVSRVKVGVRWGRRVCNTPACPGV